MSRNEITLQEMFSSVIGELRESGRWGTAHIYQSAVNAFSAFTQWQPMPMRKLSPTVLKRFENFLRQRNCSWNTVSTYIKTVRSVYHRAVDRKYIRYVPRLFEHVYTGTRADRKKALEASDIGCLVRETEMSLQAGNSPNTRQKTKIFFFLSQLYSSLFSHFPGTRKYANTYSLILMSHFPLYDMRYAEKAAASEDAILQGCCYISKTLIRSCRLTCSTNTIFEASS